MNRTNNVTPLLLVAFAAAVAAQTAAPVLGAKPQADPVDELVATMQAAEKKLKSAAIEMTTSGRLPGDLSMRVHGVLHVLRGEQAAMHCKFEYSSTDGVRGRSESAQTATGIVLLEDDLAFGQVFVQVDAKVTADLEWAGRVLERDDLPGMEPRTAAPLGSAALAAAKRQFVLAADKRTERAGEAGIWLAGPRRPGLDAQDSELAAANRIELFVRGKDHALLELREFTGDVVSQQLVVDKLELDVELPAKLFQIDGGGQRPKPAKEYGPLWEQIEQACLEAEAKSEKDAEAKNAKLPAEQHVKPELRPSKR
jgi:hypothetical protein